MTLWPHVLAACLGASFAFSATAQDADPSAATIWRSYKAHFLSDDGRIVDEAGGSNVSHSEGQGYGMLLAAFNGDAAAFDKIWAWTQGGLYVRGDDLAAWRWAPDDSPHVKDANNATDGDILIAWALAEGGERFGRPDYVERARRIAHIVAWSLTYPAPFGTAISPGKFGFGPKDAADGPVVNPSYWVYPAFTAFERIAPEVDWVKIAAGGRGLLKAAAFGEKHLPADWISLKGAPHPAEGHDATFGYDAVRVPLYLAWGDPSDRAGLDVYAQNWARADSVLATVPFDERSKAEALDAPGYRAIAALARCVAKGEPFPQALRAPEFEKYYPSTLHMLVLAALARRTFPCA